MTLLNRDEIEERRGDIFVDDCFDVTCLRAAAYDLRLAVIDESATTGTLSTSGRVPKLILAKGQRATLETLERLAMPWNLAGNIGVKYRMGIKGLFVSPGLIVDPGFGQPSGEPLRFVVTNIGADPLSIGLGPGGDHVIGIQFARVAEPSKIPEKGERAPEDVQAAGLSFFEDLARIEQQFGEVQRATERSETATHIVSVVGVIAVALAVFSVFMGTVLSVLASGEAAHNLVNELNALDTSKPWTIAVLVAFFLSSCALVVVAAVLATTALRRRIQRLLHGKVARDVGD